MAHAESGRNAAALLSTTGALVLGVGLGALAGERLGSTAWLIAAVGLVAHLWGMMTSRRIQQSQGYRFAPFESAAYWICWLIIGLGVAAAVWQLLGRESAI